LRYTKDLERLEDHYNKEEKYWKKFSEKSSEEEDIHNEKNILIVENLLSEIPSEVKEFVEKNDTTGGKSFSESSGSVGNHNSNEEKEDKSESVVEISSLPPKSYIAFNGSTLTPGGTRSLHEEERGKAIIYGTIHTKLSQQPQPN
jgi:hypothetical protein